jgi:hypothetical protein
MDTMRDAQPFKELMDQLSETLRGYKATDAWRDGMWNALKDAPFSEVKANAQRIMATATKETPFPRPASLRNKPPSLPPPPDSGRERAERESIRRWRELKSEDPVEFEILFRSARAFTELSQCSADDPGYNEWLQEFRRWDSLRYLPRAEQEAHVRTYLGRS